MTASVLTVKRMCAHCGTELMAWCSPKWFEHIASPEHQAKVADYGLDAEAQRSFNDHPSNWNRP